MNKDLEKAYKELLEAKDNIIATQSAFIEYQLEYIDFLKGFSKETKNGN